MNSYTTRTHGIIAKYVCVCEPAISYEKLCARNTCKVSPIVQLKVEKILLKKAYQLRLACGRF